MFFLDRRYLPYFWGVLGLLLLTVCTRLLGPFLGEVNIALLFLLPVLFTAVKWGRRVSVVIAILASLSFDFFLILPYGSLSIWDMRYLVSFLMFLIVAWLTGTMSQRLGNQVKEIQEREARMAALNTFSQKIAFTTDLDSVLQTLVKKIAEILDGEVVVLLSDDENHALKVMAGTLSHIGHQEYEAAIWVFHHKQAAGRGTNHLREVQGLYLPLSTEQGVIGVMGVCFNHPGDNDYQEYLHLLDAFSNLTSLAVVRIRLWEKAQETHLLQESEKLYAALLNSLSHDLHTPLASIIGAVTGLMEGEELYSPGAKKELFQTINQESQRMNRLVNNLLEMTRLEGGIVKVRKELCDLEDIIGVAVGRMKDLLANRVVSIKVKPGLALVPVDFVLMEQVLVNLIENAVKYSEPGNKISLFACSGDEWAEVSVANQGKELPNDVLEKVFDKFYRMDSLGRVGGSGLGLAICKGIVEAHGGKIWARNNPNEGVTITFHIPLNEHSPQKLIERNCRKDEVAKT